MSVAGGSFEAGETGGQGDLEEGARGEGEEGVVGLDELLGEEFPAALGEEGLWCILAEVADEGRWGTLYGS